MMLASFEKGAQPSEGPCFHTGCAYAYEYVQGSQSCVGGGWKTAVEKTGR
jgi:hypothetical protein